MIAIHGCYMSVDPETWRRWCGHKPQGRLAHECPDWDFLPMDEASFELLGCCCEWEDSGLQRLAQESRERYSKELDAANREAGAL
jgi:hypothetical protein